MTQCDCGGGCSCRREIEKLEQRNLEDIRTIAHLVDKIDRYEKKLGIASNGSGEVNKFINDVPTAYTLDKGETAAIEANEEECVACSA